MRFFGRTVVIASCIIGIASAMGWLPDSESARRTVGMPVHASERAFADQSSAARTTQLNAIASAPTQATAPRVGMGKVAEHYSDKFGEVGDKVGREIARAIGAADLPDPPPSGEDRFRQALTNLGAENAEAIATAFSEPVPQGPDPHPSPSPATANTVEPTKVDALAPTPAPHPTPSNEKDPGDAHGNHDLGDGGGGETNDVPDGPLERAKATV